ncbi:MAG: helix-turn-helix transcriptional regulator [Pseudomonadota bacterium]|nr:helix-turn-helix transcriptional regulator [Pseudomonadota bacterium]
MTLFARLVAHVGLVTFDGQLSSVMAEVFPGARYIVEEVRDSRDSVCILDSHPGERRGLAAMKLQLRGALAAHMRGGTGKTFRVLRSGRQAAIQGAAEGASADGMVFTTSAGKIAYAVCLARSGAGFSAVERDRFAAMADWLAACIIKDKEKRVVEFRYGEGVVNRIVGMSPRFSTLSPREKSVCVGILTGHTTEAIALHLEVSENSVLTFRRRLYQKLGINAQNELFASTLVAAREMSQSSSLATALMPL